jgi:hypothetical protein
MEAVSQALAGSFLNTFHAKLSVFANEVSRQSEGKVTAQQVIDLWNEYQPSAKFSGSVAAVPHVAAPSTAGVAAPTTTKKSSKKVSDGTGCCFILTRGDNRGNPCSDKCIQGSTFCSRHNKMAGGEPARTTSKK